MRILQDRAKHVGGKYHHNTLCAHIRKYIHMHITGQNHAYWWHILPQERIRCHHTYICILQESVKHTDGRHYHKRCYDTMLGPPQPIVNTHIVSPLARVVRAEACPQCRQPVYKDEVCMYECTCFPRYCVCVCTHDVSMWKSILLCHVCGWGMHACTCFLRYYVHDVSMWKISFSLSCVRKKDAYIQWYGMLLCTHVNKCTYAYYTSGRSKVMAYKSWYDTILHTYTYIYILQAKVKLTDGSYYHKCCYDTMIASTPDLSTLVVSPPARTVRTEACPQCRQPVYTDEVCMHALVSWGIMCARCMHTWKINLALSCVRKKDAYIQWYGMPVCTHVNKCAYTYYTSGRSKVMAYKSWYDTILHTYTYIYILQARVKLSDGSFCHECCYDIIKASKPIIHTLVVSPLARTVKTEACPGCGQPVYEDQVCLYACM